MGIKEVKYEPENFKNVTDAANYFSFVTYAEHGHLYKIREIVTEFYEKNPSLFSEFTDFLFLPSNKMAYTFSAFIRSEFSEVAIDNGVILNSVVKHCFGLYAKKWLIRKLFEGRKVA